MLPFSFFFFLLGFAIGGGGMMILNDADATTFIFLLLSVPSISGDACQAMSKPIWLRLLQDAIPKSLTGDGKPEQDFAIILMGTP